MNNNDPYKMLATAIIMQAIKDKNIPAKRKEVKEFFLSNWFDDLCVLAQINPDAARDKLLKIVK